MALQYITRDGYACYFGIRQEEVPLDIERKESIALILFDSVTTDRFPTADEVSQLNQDCQDSIERAFYEQINYFEIEPNSYESGSSVSTDVSIGHYSEKLGSVSTSDGRARLSPLAWNYLQRCVTEYGTLTYLGVNCRQRFGRNFD